MLAPEEVMCRVTGSLVPEPARMAQLLSTLLVDARLPVCLTRLALARAHTRVLRVGFACAALRRARRLG